MSALEMLTEAADLVETRDEQNRRLFACTGKTSGNSKSWSKSENGNSHSHENERARDKLRPINEKGTSKFHLVQNEMKHSSTNSSVVTTENINELNGHRLKDIQKQSIGKARIPTSNETSSKIVTREDPSKSYQVPENSNPIVKNQSNESVAAESSATEKYNKYLEREVSSRSTDAREEKQTANKPMVLLQSSPTTTIDIAEPPPSSRPHTIAPVTMHHPFIYPMVYPGDHSLVSRPSGNMVNEQTDRVSSPTCPSTTTISEIPTSIHHARFMYPFPSQALMMGPRSTGGLADISPFLLAQPNAAYSGATGLPHNMAMIDQYQRILGIDGMSQFSPAYSLHPQFADLYLKSLLPQGIDIAKDPLALSSLAGRGNVGLTIPPLPGQPGLNDFLRYTEHINASAGLVRPQDGISPRPPSPFTSKGRSESPAILNGGKHPGNFSYHQTLQRLNEARSPSKLPMRHLSRSPRNEMQHQEDVTSFKSLRDPTSNPAPFKQNHRKSEEGHNTYTISDERGRKITMPSGHVPHDYHSTLSNLHHNHERSPSPNKRCVEETKSFRKVSREKSPGSELVHTRHSLDSQYVSRRSPAANERLEDPQASPISNGQPTTLVVPRENGSIDIPSGLAKMTQHSHYSINHGSSGHQGSFESRQNNTGSPTVNTGFPGGVSPYLGQHLLSGLAGSPGASFLLPQHYAQFLATSGKGAQISAESLASLYKTAETAPEYQRLASLPFGMTALPLLSHPQHPQLLVPGSSRSAVLPQDYATALKAHSFLTQSQTSAKEMEKHSQGGSRDKHRGVDQANHHSLVQQAPSTLNPDSAHSMKRSPSSPHLSKMTNHHIHHRDSLSPSSVGNGNGGGNAVSGPDIRRLHSPNSPARRDRESSPKQSSNHYRPKPMLPRKEDSEHRNRKRKIDDEIGMGGEASNFGQGTQHYQSRIQKKDLTYHTEIKKEKRNQDEAAPDIEEHFRRSLGRDYVADASNKVSITGSVDDHFKKALGGDIWNKLQPTTTLPTKEDLRNSIQLTGPSLPSYSAAISRIPNPSGGYSQVNDKSHRTYEPAYWERLSNMAMHQRLVTKSPPAVSSPQSPRSSVRFSSSNPHTIPSVRQRGRAKTGTPETTIIAPDITRRTRTPSTGGKGSVTGNLDESSPAVKGVPSPKAVISSMTSSPTQIQVPIQSLSFAPTAGTHSNQSDGSKSANVQPSVDEDATLDDKTFSKSPPTCGTKRASVRGEKTDENDKNIT